MRMISNGSVLDCDLCFAVVLSSVFPLKFNLPKLFMTASGLVSSIRCASNHNELIGATV